MSQSRKHDTNSLPLGLRSVIAGEAPAAQAPKHQASFSPEPARRPRVALLLGFMAAALMLAAYAAGFVYFSSHLTPGTNINGINASFMTEAELAAAIEKEAQSFELHMSGNGFELFISGEQAQVSADGAAHAKEAFAQINPAFWPLRTVGGHTLVLEETLDFNHEAVSQIVSEAVAAHNEHAQDPQSASVQLDREKRSFVIVPEQAGTKLDPDATLASVLEALGQLRRILNLDESQLIQPALTSTDERLSDFAKRANEALARTVKVTLKGKEVASVSTDVSIDWIYLDHSDFSVHTSDDVAEAWVWDALNEIAATEDDEAIWGLDSWNTAYALGEAVKGTIEPSVEVSRKQIETKPPVSEGARERGRHIDVNLSTQYARMHDESGKVIWESYFVSGNLAENRGTPTGEFAIEAKQTNIVLVGADEDKDEKPDYESPVTYWMPFRSNIWGLHDATWRSSFGGDIYTYAGSHGCVNLPFEKAEQLFQLVNVGDKVVVHT